jgi:hypothetical protein
MFSKWWNALSEPVRFRPQLKASQQAVLWLPFIESTNDNASKWFAPLSEPPRKPSMARFDRNQFWSNFTPAPTEVITLDKYWQPLSEPTRLPKQLRAAAQQWLALVKAAPFEETVYPDKYWQELSRPARARQLPVAPYPTFFFALREDTRLVPTWWRPLSEPVRYKRILAAHQRYAFEVTRQPDVSQAAWFVTLSEPVRPPRPPRIFTEYSFGQYFAAPELVTLDKWYRPLTEPARSATFKTALQQSLIWSPRPIGTEFPPVRPRGTVCIRVAPKDVRFTYSDVRTPDSKRKRSC